MLRNPLVFVSLLVLEIWLTHAVVFFTHEYAHSFTAWAFRCKSNPLLLHFGKVTFWNLAAMVEINENVDYQPIFSSGHGAVAALIAASGVLSAPPLYLVLFLRFRASTDHPAWKMLFYLGCLMCIGNLIDYVPTRTFSSEDDMYLVEKGLGVGPWVLLFTLGPPFLFCASHFLLRMLPEIRDQLLQNQKARRITIVVISTFIFFVFFAAAGFEAGVGLVANRLALISIFCAFPLATILLWPRRAGSIAVEADRRSGD